MKRFIASLIAFLLVVMGGTALAHEFSTVILGNIDNQTKVMSELDSPQPDTIVYDNNLASGLYLTNATNYWGTVKFTCPANFDLHCIYVKAYNPYGNSSGCGVYIHADNNGQPGTLLGGPYNISGPMPHTQFTDAEVNPPTGLSFNEGDNFHVIYGPAPGGPPSSPYGWYLYLDNDGNTGSRSGISSSQSGPWDRTIPGDLRVRAGGELETYLDLACISTFTDPDQWFMEEGTVTDINAEVENVGTEIIPDYNIVYTIRNEGGGTVYTVTESYGSLAVGASAIQTAATTFTAPAAGYYFIEAEATATGDANNDNDIAEMEMGVGDIDFDWMKYDDGTMENAISSSSGGGFGQRFDPVSYPAQVDSIMVGLNADATTTDISIWHFDPITSVATFMWSYTGAVVEGWNSFGFSADEVVIYNGGFVVIYMYQTGCSMLKDDTPPIAAGNTHMPWTATHVEGTTWYEQNSGDWAFRLLASPSSSVPPDPVIETSIDVIDFGYVPPGQSADISFWVRNVGGGDDLIVSGILLGGHSNVYSVSPIGFTLPQNDSAEVTVTFEPLQPLWYHTYLGIINNSAVQTYIMQLLGEGTLDVNDPENQVIPDQFSLAQNYPNPFNPTTDIQFALPVGSNVKLTVFNTLGQEVTTLTNEHYPAGHHVVQWDAGDVPSGIYFYRLETANFNDMKKMILIK